MKGCWVFIAVSVVFAVDALMLVVLMKRGSNGFIFGVGLGAHLIRVVPNTAIMFSTYELSVMLWEKFMNPNDDQLLFS